MQEEGTIDRVVEGKTFGFITRPNGEKDLFFHENELRNVRLPDLRPGDKVTYEIADGAKGLNAVNINKV